MKQNKELLAIIGEPGVGKSTLTRTLLGPVKMSVGDGHIPMTIHEGHVHQLGKEKPDYPGTDTLPMDIISRILPWFEYSNPPRALVAEGDRLATMKFYLAARDAGYNVWIIHCVGERYAAENRAKRGSTQDETWIKSRRTKCYALARAAQEHGFKVIDWPMMDSSADALRALAMMGERWPIFGGMKPE